MQLGIVQKVITAAALASAATQLIHLTTLHLVLDIHVLAALVDMVLVVQQHPLLHQQPRQLLIALHVQMQVLLAQNQ
jgi:hypothetical protein